MPPDPVNTEEPPVQCGNCGAEVVFESGQIVGDPAAIARVAELEAEVERERRWRKSAERERTGLREAHNVHLAEVERLREALKGIVLHADIPSGEPWSEAYAEVADMARSALHPEPTEENE